MNKNIIGIDPSVNSTAVCINGSKLYNYTKYDLVYTKTDKMNKWYENIEHLVEFRLLDKELKDKELFSDSEISKLKKYDAMTDKIIEDITPYLNDAFIAMEGYSYSSNVGPIIDLVTFSTLLRFKIIQKMGNNSTLKIIPPSTLKSETAKRVYNILVKKVYKNKNGVSGGKFTKREMYEAVSDNGGQDEWSKFINLNSYEILSYLKIPKPIDDINDAFLLYLINS